MKKTELRASRYPNRVSVDQEQVYQIMDDAMFCTIAYVSDGVPYQIPTGFCRIGGSIYIHGSVKSHFLKTILSLDQVCASAMLFDALVLAPTAFNHSVNYRSVVFHAPASEVIDPDKKTEVLSAFTEKYVPGRMRDVGPPSPEEVSITTVVELSLGHASAKMRQGPVGVDTRSEEIWCGIVPAHQAYGLPEADSGLQKGIGVPDYLTKLVVKSNVK